MMCVECLDTKAVSEDPRDPPLDLGGCLCKDCGISAYDEVIEETQDYIKELQRQRREL